MERKAFYSCNISFSSCVFQARTKSTWSAGRHGPVLHNIQISVNSGKNMSAPDCFWNLFTIQIQFFAHLNLRQQQKEQGNIRVFLNTLYTPDSLFAHLNFRVLSKSLYTSFLIFKKMKKKKLKRKKDLTPRRRCRQRCCCKTISK